MNAPLKAATLTTITCEWEGDTPTIPELPDAASRAATHGVYHYRLWLPKDYFKYPQRRWPCIFVSAWAGNAKMGFMAQRLKESGYVVVLLVEARNGPSWAPIVGNFLAAHDDVVKRVRIQEGAKFATGSSGGARACTLDVQLRPGFGGLILANGGAPQNDDGKYWLDPFPKTPGFMVAMMMEENHANYFEADALRPQLPPNVQYHVWYTPGALDPEVFDKALSWAEEGIYIYNPNLDPSMKPAVTAYFWQLCSGLLAEKNPWKYEQLCKLILQLVQSRNLRTDLSLTAAIAKVQSDLTRLENFPAIQKQIQAQNAWSEFIKSGLSLPPTAMAARLQDFLKTYPDTEAAATAQQTLDLIAADKMQCVEVPIKMSNNAIYATVDIGGVKAHLQVDTGASSMVISTKIYKELRTRGIIKTPGTKGKIFGINGSQESVQNVLPEISVGAASLKNIPAEFTKEDPGSGSDGLLGDDFLRNYDVEINLGTYRMYLYPKQNSKIALLDFLIGNEDTPFYSNEHNNVHFVAEIDGHPIASILDTGAWAISMSPSVAQEIGINTKLLDRTSSAAVGIGGSAAAYIYKFPLPKYIRMGGQELKMHFASISLETVSKGWSMKSSSTMLVGLEVYKNRTLFLSFKKKRFFIF